MINFKTIISGTATGLRISAVDLKAFIDNDATIPLYADGRSIIRIYDSSNRYLEGVLGNVGSGEGLGSDLLLGWDFTSGWATSNATVNNATQFTSTANNGTVRKAYATIGALYQYAVIGAVSAGVLEYDFRKTSGELYLIGAANGTYYNTAQGTELLIKASNSGAQFTMTSQTLKQVLTPSTSGCTILNAAGAQSFISKNANFTYNAASYTYKIFANKRVVI